MKSIIAIDPGQNGGIAHQNEHGIVSCVKMPATDGDTCDHIISLVAESMSTICYLERIIGYSAFKNVAKLCEDYGMLRGILMARHIPTELVLPQRWQKPLGIGPKGERTPTQWKNILKQRAQEAFPHIDMTLAQSDALLILKYAQQQMGVKVDPSTLF